MPSSLWKFNSPSCWLIRFSSSSNFELLNWCSSSLLSRFDWLISKSKLLLLLISFSFDIFGNVEASCSNSCSNSCSDAAAAVGAVFDEIIGAWSSDIWLDDELGDKVFIFSALVSVWVQEEWEVNEEDEESEDSEVED